MKSSKQQQPSQSSSDRLSRQAIVYLVLLAVQFGCQPILTRRFAPSGVNRSTIVLMQELVKFFLAATFLFVSGAARESWKNWSVISWLAVALFPALLYSVQNLASIMAYQNLDALTFNVLNQTKTLSAALCTYLVMGKTQSQWQIVALFLLFLSALVMEGIVPVDALLGSFRTNYSQHTNRTKDRFNTHHLTYGVAPLLLASFISGLAGAVAQKNLQTGARNSYQFSMELCIATILILTGSLLVAPDGRMILEHGFWHNWTLWTWIPIFTNAIGGVLVGLVTKYAGSVSKGFALIFGMLLSGMVQAMIEPDIGVSAGQVVGGLLAATSLYLHSTNPPKPKTVKQD
ncbi:solute carrier family 35 (UDP-sugar transporter), member A1/2/3 [Fistulifera solaris]|uniref:Solute carrier family 35 (UDP-sugar transporter), member A1/2/3 n=1 Tax=Fistulifera solaris TaxID=1519565 RepID=A0A1Z5JBF3_FISSO|nr:solute carrier family 35 (UDP-sugar transporter), member A1/2/3 [Fistulifera solaris]|eukprot:GAX11317.1 solute carrier family 35 (UDP-sugar transporter), member A1/2/3 [Fistulifera solaris]